MRLKMVLLLVPLLLNAGIQTQLPKKIVNKLGTHWFSLHNNFENASDVWGNYTLDLTLEAFLYYDLYLKSDYFTDKVLTVFEKRDIAPSDTINYRTQPFCSINFALGKVTGNTTWYTGYIAETYRMYHEAVKSPEGAVMIHHKENYYVLVDYLQEYASRLAKTGYLTGDSLLFRECVDQFLRYERLLKNESTGLWSQGRGWCPDDTTLLGEGAWSRGHGWLLRGLVTSMVYLPDTYRTELIPVLESVSEALLSVQAGSGMYHILLHRPISDSAPDVSGTGMIAWYTALATKEGWLDEEKYKKHILKATNAMKQYISKSGEVLSSSIGPGPLCNDMEYVGYIPEIDEKHGFQGAVYGMLAEILLK